MDDDLKDKSAHLASFIARGAVRPFIWGRCDCALWACDWVLERCGIDPLAAFRGTYATEDQCREIVVEYGGLTPLIESCFAIAGLRRGPADMGAVGIVGTLLGPALMIATGNGKWIGKAPRGIRMLRAEAENVWSV